MTPNHRLVSWLLVASLTAALTAVTTVQALRRYHELRTGWSWDLAYYNQWFWSLTQADGQLSVRPVASYAEEGPSVWKMNYLAPIRLALVPFYRIHPDPAHPLVIQNIMFWWIIPAAYTLARSESRSEAIAVSAAALVPFRPCSGLWSGTIFANSNWPCRSCSGPLKEFAAGGWGWPPWAFWGCSPAARNSR